MNSSPSDSAILPSKPTLFSRLRTYFFTGILVTAPASITLYTAWLFISYVDEKVASLIPDSYNPQYYFPFGLPGLGLFLVIITLTLIGALTANFLGRFVVRSSEFFLNRTPIIRGIYSALKQVFHTVFSERSTAFRQVVLLEYPRKDIWCMGFITGETEGEVQSVTDDKVINVFLPTTPNPTSGFLLFVPKKELIPLQMSIEDGLKMIISGGIIVPPEERRSKKS